MINRTQVSLCLVATVSLLAGCHRNSDTSAVADQLRKDALALVADYNAQNATAAAAFDAPDYVGVIHGTANTDSPAADLAGMKAGMAAARVRWDIGEPKVTVAKAGDIGIFEAPKPSPSPGRTARAVKRAATGSTASSVRTMGR